MPVKTRLSPEAAARRDGLVRLFRRQVWERNELAPFEHQAEWILATEGLVLGPPHDDPLNSIVLMQPDESLVVRGLYQRPDGAAHVGADLGAYKSGKSFSVGGLWLPGFACLPNQKVQLIGLEYKNCEHEFDYLIEVLLSKRGMRMKYRSLQNDARGGRMSLVLKNGMTFECKSWTQKESLKGDEITAYAYVEAYMFPGLECFTTLSQNLRAQQGYASFSTTADRAWVSIFHERGHGVDPDWHCTCSVPGTVNPFTFDKKAQDRDNPSKGGIMTKERYAIAWLGRLGDFAGRVYNYQRGERKFNPATHPSLWKPRVVKAYNDAHAQVTEVLRALQN